MKIRNSLKSLKDRQRQHDDCKEDYNISVGLGYHFRE